jgi:hypothetical protein
MTGLASLPLDTFALLAVGAFFALALVGAIITELDAIRTRRAVRRRFRRMFPED